MFSNNSVMDLPHFGMHSSTTKSKCQTQHRQQQHPLFLSDITNSKPKSISWLKNNKQHQHISFVPFSSGFSSPSPPPLKHLPLSDRRNQPLPTLPTYSSSPSPPLSPSLSSPTSAVTNNKTIDNCSSLLPTPGSYRRMQDDSFLKFLEQKGTAKSTTSSHGIKSKNKRSTTSSSASVRSLKVDNSGDSTYGSTTLRSLPSVSTPLARHSPSSVTRSHQPSALPIRNTNRARSSSSPPSPPIKEVTDLILTELSATPTSMPTPPTSPSMATAIASSLSTPMVVSPSSSSSSSTSTSSASSAMNSLHNRNKYNKAAYPLTQNSYEEQDRLVAQHYLLRTAFHGNDYMATVMTPLLQQGCVVLDMGCGSGTWTMELATAYPASHFIGLDQLALFPKDIKPKNCHFATCDLTSLPLSIPDASVDYIFQRDLNWALLASQWPALIKEYMRILKPGGWIELMEMDIESQSSQRHERMFNDKLIYGLSMRQQDPYVARRLPSLLAINGFRRVSSQFQSLPLGWGKAHQHQKETSLGVSPAHSTVSLAPTLSSPCSEYARAASSQYRYLLHSLFPWLSTVMGCSSEKYKATIDQLALEWSQAHTYIKWHSAVAQKPAAAIETRRH